MSELGVDAAVFTSYHNILYYTQFLYSSFGRPCGLIVTRDDITTVTGGRLSLHAEADLIIKTATRLKV